MCSIATQAGGDKTGQHSYEYKWTKSKALGFCLTCLHEATCPGQCGVKEESPPISSCGC